jgi:hypothetical protein
VPKPIVCLSAAARQFIELFGICFIKRQWKYFVIVLLGLIECEGRRTLCGLRAVVGEQAGRSDCRRDRRTIGSMRFLKRKDSV